MIAESKTELKKRRLTIPKTAGRATGSVGRAARRRRPPHDSENRRACDAAAASDACGAALSASRFRKPQGVRQCREAQVYAVYDRLTIPKTAGRATNRPWRRRARATSASRFRKPQGVRQPIPVCSHCHQPRLTIPKTAGRATVWLYVRQFSGNRLTIPKTAGRATPDCLYED